MRRRFIAAVAAAMVFLVGCDGGDEVVEPRRPDVLGWVVGAQPSTDYVREDFEVRSGSIVLTLESGAEVVVDESTDVVASCQSFAPPEGATKPCWLHVGLAADLRTAEWVEPFRVYGWQERFEPGGTPVPDPDLVVAAKVNIVLKVTETELILADGTVLPWDRDSVAVLTGGGVEDIDRLLTSDSATTLLIVDHQTGALTALDRLFAD